MVSDILVTGSGEVALTYAEVAIIFTTALGRQIQYSNPAIPIFIWQMLRQGFPLQFVLVMVGIHTTARFGLAGMVTLARSSTIYWVADVEIRVIDRSLAALTILAVGIVLKLPHRIPKLRWR